MQTLKGIYRSCARCPPLCTSADVTLVVTDEHESSLRMTREQHVQQLDEARRASATAQSVQTRPTFITPVICCVKWDTNIWVFPHRSAEQQKTQEGLEEMKQQYLSTVEKIRGRLGFGTRGPPLAAQAQVCCVWQET